MEQLKAVIEREPIKTVAIYLRKSRDDADKDVLTKHRAKLIDYANYKGWKFEIYEEVVSGERLKTRPKMLELLDCIEQGLFDGVLVIDYDRLSRGGTRDFGEIIETCQYSDTKIITPDKIYDTNNSDDLMLLGLKSTFSGKELAVIKERFINGKKSGAKQGNWTNGKPPFPYEYKKEITINAQGKEVVQSYVIVNEEHRPTYNLMKELYISGQYNFESIAHYLNNKGMLTAKGGLWSNVTIQRTILHEFHTGKVVYGKNKWKKDRQGQKKLVATRNEEEWAVGYGNHEKLKTEKEQQAILAVLNRNNKVPHRARLGIFALSGLLYCKKCGKRMKINPERTKEPSERYIYIGCYKKDKFGVKCEQQGLKLDDDFYTALYDTIVNSYLDRDKLLNMEDNSTIVNINRAQLKKAQEELQAEEIRLDKVMTAYENNVYSLEQFSYRKTPIENKIKDLKRRIVELEHEIQGTSKINDNELSQRISYFMENWQNATTPKEQNDLLKTIVKKIYYDRNDDEVILEIEFM